MYVTLRNLMNALSDILMEKIIGNTDDEQRRYETN